MTRKENRIWVKFKKHLNNIITIMVNIQQILQDIKSLVMLGEVPGIRIYKYCLKIRNLQSSTCMSPMLHNKRIGYIQVSITPNIHSYVIPEVQFAPMRPVLPEHPAAQ